MLRSCLALALDTVARVRWTRSIILVLLVVVSFAVMAEGATQTTSWSWVHNHPNDSVDYYRIWWRTLDGEFYCYLYNPYDPPDQWVYIGCENVGYTDEATITTPEGEYCFAITAVDDDYSTPLESDFSDEVCIRDTDPRNQRLLYLGDLSPPDPDPDPDPPEGFVEEEVMHYLSVDEQSTYIDITCDGYVARVEKGNTFGSAVVNIYDPAYAGDNDYRWFRFGGATYVSSTTYSMGYDANRTTEILEITPSRVTVRVVGNYRDSGGTYLGGAETDHQFVYIYTFYADRVAVDFKFTAGEALTIAVNATNNFIQVYEEDASNPTNINESGGSESTGGTYSDDDDLDSWNYVGFTSDEVNVQAVCTHYSANGVSITPTQRLRQAGSFCFDFDDGTLAADDVLEMSVMMVIDSVFRKPTTDHADHLFNWDCSDVDDLPTGLTKVGSPTNTEGGLECNASGESITLTTSGNLDISQGTLKFKFKSNQVFSDSVLHVPFGSGGAGTDAGDFMIFKSSSNYLRFTIADSSGGEHSATWSTSGIVDDDWQSQNEYMFVWDSSNTVDGTYHIALYKNKQHVPTTSRTNIASSWTDATLDSNVGIGNDYEDTSRFMDGIMWDLWIFDDPHAKKYSSVERLEIGEQYKDTTMADPDNGSWVDDLLIPANIGVDGFATDGAWHVESDSDNVIKIELDRTRHGINIVQEDPPILTGIVGYDDSVTFSWDCSDVDNLPTGLTESGTAVNSEGGYECTDTNHIYLSTSGNMDISQGIVEFDFKSNASFTDGTWHVLFGCRDNGGNQPGDFTISKWTDNRVYFWIEDSGGTGHYVYYDSSKITDWQRKHRYNFYWDSSNPVDGTYYLGLKIDGVEVTPTGHANGTSSWTDATLDSTVGLLYNVDQAGMDADGIMWNLAIGDDPSVASLQQKDHRISHWKCNDDAASTTITDHLGRYDGTLNGGNNTEDITSTDSIRGSSFLLSSADTDELDLASALAGLTSTDEFSIFIRFKPNFSITTGSNQYLIHIGSGSTDRLSFYYDRTPDRFNLLERVNNVSESNYVGLDYTAYTDAQLQQWHELLISINLINNFGLVMFNGEITSFPIAENWSGTVDEFDINWIGAADYYVDEIKLIDGCLLPFGGGPFVGNGEVDADVTHSSVLFHWDAESSGANASNIPADKTITLNGGALTTGAALVGTYGYDSQDNDASISVVDSDIINPKKGSIGFWFNPQETSTWASIWGFGDIDDYISLSLNGSSIFRAVYCSNTTTEVIDSSITAVIGTWYHLRVTWDDSDYVHFYINGVEEGTPQAIANVWDGITSGSMYFGSDYAGQGNLDGYFDQIYITNNPNTPDRWSIFGTPIHQPLIEVVQ